MSEHHINDEVPEGVELTFTSVGDVILKRLGATHAVAGYLVHDEDCRDPTEDCDSVGKIYTTHRHSSTQSDMQNAMGLDSNWEPNFDLLDVDEIDYIYIETHGQESYDLCGQDPVYAAQWDAIALACWKRARANGSIGNPYALWLDVYEHSNMSFSLSGEGMQCRWDTARRGACWAPDDALLEHINSFPEAERAANAERICRLELETYNDWNNGNCYGIVIATYDLNTNELIDSNECWGYVGFDYAYAEMKALKHVPLTKGYQMELTV